MVLIGSVSVAALGTFLIVNINSIWNVVIISSVLGFFSGMVYPLVLNYLNDFAAGKTATAAGMITASTGLGGAAITMLLGRLSEQFGIQTGFLILGGWIGLDIVLAALLLAYHYEMA